MVLARLLMQRTHSCVASEALRRAVTLQRCVLGLRDAPGAGVTRARGTGLGAGGEVRSASECRRRRREEQRLRSATSARRACWSFCWRSCAGREQRQREL